MVFSKYHHIERIGNEEVEGLLDGTVHVYPKIDGTNASIWMHEGGMHFGSRKRELSEEKDNAGFLQWAALGDDSPNFLGWFEEMGYDFRLYGEWLVPHTMKDYREDASLVNFGETFQHWVH